MAKYIEREKLAEALRIWKNMLIETYGENDEHVRCLDSVLLGVDNAPAADVLPRDEAIKMGAELAAMHGSDATSQQLEEAYLKGVEYGMTRRDVRDVVKATWIVKEMQALFPGMDEHPVFACSECGYQIYDLLDNVKERHHYCTNCGADMRGTNE